jgi:hypothetical protein
MSTYQFTASPGLCPPSGSTSDLSSDEQPEPVDADPPSKNPLPHRNLLNWSGWEAYPASGNTYVAISGEFDQAARGDDSCQNDVQTTWIGIGGSKKRSDGSRGLLQLGTEVPTSGAKFAWWEYVGQTSTADGNRKIGVDPVAIPTSGSGSFAVHAGDHLHLSMFYQSSTQMVNFVYQNETTGAFLPLNFKVDSKFYEPNSGEFITERKTVNSELAPLNNFKTISWNSAKVENDDGNWVYLASTHSQMKDILVGQNRVTLDYYTMAKPGAIGGTSGGAFDDTFVRCQ